MRVLREDIEIQKISVRQCIIRLTQLTKRYGNDLDNQLEAFHEEAQALISSLENSNCFDVSRELRRLEKDPYMGELIQFLRTSAVLSLLPQEPSSLKEFILLVCRGGPITMNVFETYADCLERFGKERGLSIFSLRKEMQRLYQTDREVCQAIDELLGRRDWIELIQREIDLNVRATGVTQERACEFLARKDYVGLVEHFFNAQPLMQYDIGRSADWVRQLDEQLAKMIAAVTTTWSANFLLPSFWKTVIGHFKQISTLRPQPEELSERLQALYQTNPAIKKQVDGLLHPGYLNPDSLTKKNVILAIVHLGMYLGLSQLLKVSQEDAFGLLGQKRYAELVKRVLVSV